jgi:hypothetical protein
MRRAVILLTLTAAAAALPAIALAKPPHVRPSVSVLSEKVRGTSVTFTLDVRFIVPHGVPPRKACKGKVSVSVKKTRWSGRFANHNGICDAHVKGRLPKAAEGTKVRFKVAFKGNSAIAAFSSSKSLKLIDPVGGGSPPGSARFTAHVFNDR